MKFKTIFIFIFAILCTGISLAGIFMFLGRGPKTASAIIVDNLGLDGVSPSGRNVIFINETIKILKNFDVRVDYVDVDDVTLDVYRNLAQYNLVILRVHSGLLTGDNVVCFFTSEPLSRQKLSKYYDWFANGCLANATLGKRHFIGVKPDFIIQCLNGEFQDSIIIAMGCNSLINDSMAKAFVDHRKASVYIGWTRDVTANYTDNATLTLLERFFLENATIKEAVKGLEDPRFHSILKYYPKKVENLRLNEIIERLQHKTSLSVFSVVNTFSKVQMILLPISNWLNFSYRRFFRKF